MLILGIILNIFITPHFYRWYIDEPNTLEKARTIITGDEFTKPAFEHPIGWLLFLTTPFLMFGVDVGVALYASSILGILTAINIFLIGCILSKKRIGFIAGALYLLIPTVLIYAGSAINNTPSNFFLTLAFIFILLSLKKTNKQDIKLTIIFAIITIGIASLFRTENHYLFVMYFVLLLVYKKPLRTAIIATIIVLIIILPNITNSLDLYLGNKLAQSNISADTQTWSATNVFSNVETFKGLVNGKLHPMIFTALLLIGIISRFKTKQNIIMLLWSIPILLSFTLYFDVPPRFMIGLYPLFCIMAAEGLNYLLEMKNLNRAIKVALPFLVLLSFVTPTIAIHNNISKQLVLETRIPDMIKKDAPNCSIITIKPTIIRSTSNLEAIRIQDFLKGVKPRNSCILFYEDIYCNGALHREEECQTIKKEFKVKEYKTYSIKEAKQTFYKIDLNKNQ